MCLLLKLFLCFSFLVVSKCQGYYEMYEYPEYPYNYNPYHSSSRWHDETPLVIPKYEGYYGTRDYHYYPYYTYNRWPKGNPSLVPESKGYYGMRDYDYYPSYTNNEPPQENPNPLLISDLDDWVVDDEGCRTPDGGVGDCIPIRTCQPMIDILKKLKKPLSDKTTQQLNAYYCSFKNGVSYVCCPGGPIVIQTETYVENQKPPDVSNHRNINLLPTDCGIMPADLNKIRNGKDADLNEFPWMALLSYRTRRGPEFKCGGTILNNRYILTAAHCIQNVDSPLLGVRVGEYNIRTKQDCVTYENQETKCTVGVQDVAIEEIIPHPLFNATIITNDIGLIRVSRMNLQVENARPVCLPLGELKDDEFKNVVVTGWGVTDVQTGATSAILQKVNLPVMDLEKCKEAYKSQSRAQLTFRQVCAGGRHQQDSCPGDSGGPLHEVTFYNGEARYVQQGVVSFGPRECGLEGYPGVYTRVAYYMDWILDTIKP